MGCGVYAAHGILQACGALLFVLEIIGIDAEGNNDYEQYANQVGEGIFDRKCG